MNIQEAKEQIKNAMRAYFTKDEYGNYLIPVERQRPVYLLGAPGIGKTAIMTQIAQELGVGLVSYSMTHHTRQSAIGLPFISQKTYGQESFSVSEYTLSEIIASVYDMIEASGHDEGILFLDEINCVSETLTPAILQFLQYKIFGRHQVPQGWIVVTAGNPPEYNRSVHDFDIATWDRLKRIDVEPDFEVWKQYALNQGVHPSIITYLEIRPADFYRIESTVDGKSFVTARGWDDLSQMITLYELNGIEVSGMLVGQYVQNPEIAKRFAVYYELFNKYKSDYQIDAILQGGDTQAIYERCKAAAFDERISFISLLIDAINTACRDILVRYEGTKLLHEALRSLKFAHEDGMAIKDALVEKSSELTNFAEKQLKIGALSRDIYVAHKAAAEFLDAQAKLPECTSFEGLKAAFQKRLADLDVDTKGVQVSLERALAFVDEAFGQKQEILLMVTDLSSSAYSMNFINKYGSDLYFKFAAALQFSERGSDLVARIAQVEQELE